MRKAFKRVVSLVLATAIVAGGVMTDTKKADAAKTYNCYLMWMSDDFKCKNMESTIANTKIKNKKGTAKYTVTLKMSQAQGEFEGDKPKASKGAKVFCIDIQDILKDYNVKKVKISNVVIKCDGKVVKINQKKLVQGALEPEGDPDKYRLEIFNEWGEGGTKNNPCAKPKAFKWKKSISVSFNLKLK